MKRPTLILLIVVASIPFGLPIEGAEDLDFSRDVLPILSDKCFACHGPDASEGDLRLDRPENATADLGGHRAIDTEDPARSELLTRIFSDDDPMPPADAEKQLSKSEREILKTWVMSGAAFAAHWAFEPPRPSADHDGSTPQQIDQLIQRKLDAQSIHFAPEAERETLARRAALVLTGLPPDPSQLQRFLADESQDSYERLVDDLLASPRFGEHQARYWLDAVRYGDTHGLHLDNRRGIYPYRDWVVQAMNQNLPLDDFITWQIAGDLLPSATLSQRVATGFVRLNPSTGEGGAIAEEFQAKNNFDRVETLGTVFLGLSLTCARCHNHKYDPITQDDYYRLMAFFNSTAEPALDGNSYTYGPTIKVPRDQTQWSRWNQLEAERERLVRSATEPLQDAQRLAELVDTAKKRSGWNASNWSISPIIQSASAEPLPPSASDPSSPKLSPIKQLPGVLSGRSARGKVPGEGQWVWIVGELQVPSDQQLLLTFSGAAGSELFIDEQTVAIPGDPSPSEVSIVGVPMAAGDHRIAIKVVGSSKLADLEIQITNPWDSLAKTGQWNETPLADRLEILADATGPCGGSSHSDHAQRVAKDIREITSNFTTTLVAHELPQPRPTHVLRRGEYDLPIGDPLQPDVISMLGPIPEGLPQNRQGLAAWLTSPNNPLVARVLVNRIWQRTFGQGLVKTPEDFGMQGRQPSHPALLDWLAVELHRSDWDLKHLLRLLVTSRTFRQSSAWRDDIDDPENLLYARGPSYRLDAEVLRDVGLWASDLLDPTMGGEGVKPYQPDGMWMALAHPASNTKQYERDHGRRLYRRSLYVYWKRTSPHPMMTLFDAPDRESSCVRRSRTNTALQSLALLNETQRVEMGRKLAERLLQSSATDNDRLNQMFRLLSSREPDDREREACEGLLKQMRARYTQSKDDAAQLLSIGEAARDESLDDAELAAWTQVCLMVLASDLTIMLY